MVESFLHIFSFVKVQFFLKIGVYLTQLFKHPSHITQSFCIALRIRVK
jgi:hypothetical protein